MARQRYYRPSARCCRVRRVSADRAARPSPHTRGKPRLLNLGRRIPARDRFATDSPLEGDGFEPSVPLFERVLSALPNGDAGPIGWMGSLSPGRLARRRSLRADPFSTAVSLRRDRWFESVSLHRRVRCEPDSLIAHNASWWQEI